MTLLVRDEEDVLERMLRYHFALGVDFVVATDHRSSDATPEILAAFEREGRLRVLRETSQQVRQSEWVTAMARLAATEHGADWVINADADEFWWPRYASLHETLDLVPARFGVVRGLWRHFVPRPLPPDDFVERMTVRTTPTDDLDDPFHAQVKVAHRARADVRVSQGNHDAEGSSLLLVREWFPFEVFHFPLRSAAQVARKYRRPEEPDRWGPRPPRHIAVAAHTLRERGGDAFYAAHVLDDDAVARGVAAGTLAVDERLRDALRALETGSALPDTKAPSLAEDVELAAEAQVIALMDARLRLDDRARTVEQRIQRVEGSLAVRLARRLA